MKKRYMAFIAIAVVTLIVLKFLIDWNIYNSTKELVAYNLMDILTITVVTFGLYFVTKLNDNIKKKNEKVESIIEILNNKFKKICGEEIKTAEHKSYLTQFKSIDNKISHLKVMSKHLKCEKLIDSIENKKEQIDNFITENINEGDDYFLKEERKDKLPNLLVNIENDLDQITNVIYIN